MMPFLFCIILFWLVACENDSLSANEPPLSSSSSSEPVPFSSSAFFSSSSELRMSSSSAFVESSSSSVLKSSASVSVFKGLIIQNGDETTTVNRWEADSVFIQAPGRFWLLAQEPLGELETETLEGMGIYKQRCYEGYRYYLYDYEGPYQEDLSIMTLCLMKSKRSVSKSALDEVVNYSLYNTFDADESVLDGIVFKNRGKEFLLKRIDDDSVSVQAAGRFWLVLDYPLDRFGAEALEEIGVGRVTCSALHQDQLEMTICLMKSEMDVNKSAMVSALNGFYNTFSVDDTTKLEVDVSDADWVVENEIVDAKVYCWDDVSMDACKAIVESCQGENVSLDRSVVLTTASLETIDCLAENRDVLDIDVFRERYEILD